MSKYQVTSGAVQAPVKAVLYGPEGIGKSTFASKFPAPVFIDTEGGTKRLDVQRLPTPTSWAMLLDEVAEVRKGSIPCQTLVIDTADWAERLCIAAVCAKGKVDGLEDFGYGKGYVYVKEEYGKLLDALEDVIATGRNVVVLAHAQLVKYEQPDAIGNYDRWGMKTTKHVAPLLREWCDMLLFANYRIVVEKVGSGTNAKSKASGGKRVLYTSHHPCWDAKNRFGLDDVLPFDFSAIAHCVPGQGAKPAPAMPAIMVEDDPVPTAPKTAPSPAQVPAAMAWVPMTTEPQKDTATTASPAQQLDDRLAAEGVPDQLRSLMVANGVNSFALRHAVFQRGCYPEDTPIANYDPQFVQGSLIASWAKWLAFIRENEDVPF